MKYELKVVREYTTFIEVEAQSVEQAIYLASNDDNTREKLYAEEFEQCNSRDVTINVHPSNTMEKNFAPNGFHSWIETYYELTLWINDKLETDWRLLDELLVQFNLGRGKGGMYELAEMLTNKFEAENKGRNWDGDWFDTLDTFTDNLKTEKV